MSFYVIRRLAWTFVIVLVSGDLGYVVVEEIIQPHIQARWFDPLAASVDPMIASAARPKTKLSGRIAPSHGLLVLGL